MYFEVNGLKHAKKILLFALLMRVRYKDQYHCLSGGHWRSVPNLKNCWFDKLGSSRILDTVLNQVGVHTEKMSILTSNLIQYLLLKPHAS